VGAVLVTHIDAEARVIVERFLRDVLINVLANLIAAAIIYLLG